MLAEGRTGLVTTADGGVNPLRIDKTGALVTTGGHAQYGEPVLRGNMQIVSNLVAGVAPGTVLTTTPPMSLWNPPASGRNLVILKTGLAYVSGTLGAGFLAYAQVPAQMTAPTGGAELTPVNALLGFPRGVGRAFNGSTWASTPALIKAVYSMGAALATSAFFPFILADVVDGEIVLAPGTGFVMQMVGGAGASPLLVMSITWEEVLL